MNITDRIIEHINHNYTSGDIVNLWNEYCEDNRYYDDMIYDVCCIDDMTSGLSPLEILDRYGDVNTNDCYFVETIYGAKSFDYYDDGNSPVYLDDLVDWIIREEHSDFSELFEEFSEED